MNLDQVEAEVLKCIEIVLSPRNMSLTEIERLKVRLLGLKTLAEILQKK